MEDRPVCPCALWVFSGGVVIRLGCFASRLHARGTLATPLSTALRLTNASVEKRGGQGWGGWAGARVGHRPKESKEGT